jgi:HAD superfamily hydrolase (TIGR01490 family)
MTLAIFDLDNTLLGGDSDYLWGRFLVEQHVVDGPEYERENERFYREYVAGTLNIYDFLRFQLRPLAEHEPAQLLAWRKQFLQEKIEPVMLPAARKLLQRHRQHGHTLLIITATNRFITQPIAERLGVEHLLATEPEQKDGRYTGGVTGIPCYQDGKVKRLRQWLDAHDQGLQGSWFYSDSHNDLPLLEQVTHPVAVDPDATLAAHAERHGWPVITLREPRAP